MLDLGNLVSVLSFSLDNLSLSFSELLLGDGELGLNGYGFLREFFGYYLGNGSGFDNLGLDHLDVFGCGFSFGL